MKKSLNAWSVDDRTGFEDMFKQLTDAGFDGVELNLDRPGRSEHSLTHETTDGELIKIKELSDRYSLPVVSISCSLYGDGCMGSPDAGERAREKDLEEAAQLRKNIKRGWDTRRARRHKRGLFDKIGV